jgi:hypothetical protein
MLPARKSGSLHSRSINSTPLGLWGRGGGGARLGSEQLCTGRQRARLSARGPLSALSALW